MLFRSRGLARKLSEDGVARASVATPDTVAVASPCTARPRRRASSAALNSMPAALELPAEGELQAFQFVALLVPQRERVADSDRTHRRAPQQRNHGRCAQPARVARAHALLQSAA